MEDENKKEESKTPLMVNEAVLAAERLEKANKEMKDNISKLEELKAFQILGGKTEGAEQVKKPVEISNQEYANLALQGKLPSKE